MVVNPAKKGCRQEIGIVHLVPHGRPWISEACRGSICPIEVIDHVPGGTGRDFQIPGVSLALISIQERVCGERSGDQIGRTARNQFGACLPRKTVAPTPVRDARRSKGNQLLDHHLDRGLWTRVPDSIELEERREEERQGLWIPGFRNQQETAEVDGATLHRLSEDEPGEPRIEEWQRFEHSAVERIVRIVTGPPVGVTVSQKLEKRWFQGVIDHGRVDLGHESLTVTRRAA